MQMIEFFSPFGPVLLAEAPSNAVQNTWQFFKGGGPFMMAILVCSLVALAVIIFKLLTLKKSRVVPARLAEDMARIEVFLDSGSLGEVEGEIGREQSTLARLCAVVLRRADQPRLEVQEAVQTRAREEILRLHAGLPVLEVIINIAPLLGLLGTASGLFLVFGDLGGTANHGEIAKGISMALSTTIVGLAVAVPSVIAHSHFNRKIEMMAVRLEVLLTHVVTVTHTRAVARRGK